MMADLFSQALEAKGERYLMLESQLAARAEANAADAGEIAARKTERDPLVRLLAAVVLEWGTSLHREFEAVFDYLAEIPAWAAQTPKGAPSPSGVESYLSLCTSSGG